MLLQLFLFCFLLFWKQERELHPTLLCLVCIFCSVSLEDHHVNTNSIPNKRFIPALTRASVSSKPAPHGLWAWNEHSLATNIKTRSSRPGAQVNILKAWRQAGKHQETGTNALSLGLHSCHFYWLADRFFFYFFIIYGDQSQVVQVGLKVEMWMRITSDLLPLSHCWGLDMHTI